MAMRKIGSHTTQTSDIGFVALTCLSFSAAATAVEYRYQDHELTLSARGRLAEVNAVEDARAASLLLRLNLQSEWSKPVTTLVEMDYVMLGWEDEFDNGVNFNGKPVIPDVAGGDINQAWLRYSATRTAAVIIGREAVNLGNQRFVGSNGFWQNEQTLDGAVMQYEFGFASYLSYRYVGNANRINGNEAGSALNPDDAIFVANSGVRPAQFLGDHEHNSHVLFGEFKEWDSSTIQAYFIDMEIADAQSLSNNSLGARYEYRGRIGKWRVLGHAELAAQKRPRVSHKARFWYGSMGIGFGYRSSEVTIGYEQLGEDLGVSFVTPLASLHDHNGWADKFLITPGYGLRDYSLKYIWRSNPFKVDTRFHLFHADTDSRTIGQEWDIDIEYNLTKKDKVSLRFADFSAKDVSVKDETRLFLMYSHDL